MKKYILCLVAMAFLIPLGSCGQPPIGDGKITIFLEYYLDPPVEAQETHVEP